MNTITYKQRPSSMNGLIMDEHAYLEWLDEGIRLICQQGEWFVGDALPSVVDPYSKAFECVYVMTHEKYPYKVKIGITKTLRGRMRGYKSEFSGRMPVLLAVLKTDKSFLLETLLKYKFRDCVAHGEWFADGAILDWLGAWS